MAWIRSFERDRLAAAIEKARARAEAADTAQGLAMLGWMAGPSLAMFSFFSVNALAILLWTAAGCVLVGLCRSRDPRWRVALGLVLGAGFPTKHTVLVLIAGIDGAALLTDLRRDLGEVAGMDRYRRLLRARGEE